MSRGKQLITNGYLYLDSLDGTPLASDVSADLKITGEFETTSTLGDYR